MKPKTHAALCVISNTLLTKFHHWFTCYYFVINTQGQCTLTLKPRMYHFYSYYKYSVYCNNSWGKTVGFCKVSHNIRLILVWRIKCRSFLSTIVITTEQELHRFTLWATCRKHCLSQVRMYFIALLFWLQHWRYQSANKLTKVISEYIAQIPKFKDNAKLPSLRE